MTTILDTVQGARDRHNDHQAIIRRREELLSRILENRPHLLDLEGTGLTREMIEALGQIFQRTYPVALDGGRINNIRFNLIRDESDRRPVVDPPASMGPEQLTTLRDWMRRLDHLLAEQDINEDTQAVLTVLRRFHPPLITT